MRCGATYSAFVLYQALHSFLLVLFILTTCLLVPHIYGGSPPRMTCQDLPWALPANWPEAQTLGTEQGRWGPVLSQACFQP